MTNQTSIKRLVYEYMIHNRDHTQTTRMIDRLGEEYLIRELIDEEVTPLIRAEVKRFIDERPDVPYFDEGEWYIKRAPA